MMYLQANVYNIASALEQEPSGWCRARARLSRVSKILFSRGHSPKCADAAASTATAPWGLGGRPRRGARKRRRGRRRAPWQLTIKLVGSAAAS
eukprot:scaffold223005_cov37-Tisochrysis_lutea.AAC.1